MVEKIVFSVIVAVVIIGVIGLFLWSRKLPDEGVEEDSTYHAKKEAGY